MENILRCTCYAPFTLVDLTARKSARKPFLSADTKNVGRRVRVEQETQLSLTNRATRLEVIKVTKHGTIPYVMHGFLLVSLRRAVFQIFDF